MGIHHDFTGRQVHTPFFRVYPDAEAREADTTIISSDVGKMALQESDHSVWTLISVGPLAWKPSHGLTFGAAIGDVPKVVDIGSGRPGLPPELGSIPAGFIGAFGGETAPQGWLKCNGAAISRTAYAALFEAIGTAFGEGDGSTTFLLPDTRGVVLRGVDDGRGLDAGRVLGTYQEDCNKAHSHSIGAVVQSGYGLADESGSHLQLKTASTSSSGGPETRMKNLAVHHIIKY
jgi:microcystin-dependent protein